MSKMMNSAHLKSMCGVATLCGAAIFSLFAVAFVGIAVSTDNWQHISVNRNELLTYVEQENDTKLLEEFYSDVRYFDRVEGLFRVCFPMKDKPPVDQTIYLNPVDEWCTNIEYYMQLLENGLIPEKVTKHAETWIHVARASIASFILYFAVMGVAYVIGFLGCWKVSSDKMIVTAVLMLFAFVFGISGMGLFHAAKHFEHYKVFDERMKFFQTWPRYLQETTQYTLGWSYIVSWLGIAFTLIASFLFTGAATALKMFKTDKSQDIQDELMNHAHEIVDHYSGTLRRFGSVASLRPQMQMHTVMYNPNLFPKDYQSLPHMPDDASYIDYNNSTQKLVREFKDSRL